MKILLDECVTKHLKAHLIGHEVLTAKEMDWGGIKNGRLMMLRVEQHFDNLLTIDNTCNINRILRSIQQALKCLLASQAKWKNL